MGIVVSRDGAVAVVEIDRQASLNALDLETVTELEVRIRELSADALAAECERIAEVLVSDDAREGRTAFLENREPAFAGASIRE